MGAEFFVKGKEEMTVLVDLALEPVWNRRQTHREADIPDLFPMKSFWCMLYDNRSLLSNDSRAIKLLLSKRDCFFYPPACHSRKRKKKNQFLLFYQQKRFV